MSTGIERIRQHLNSYYPQSENEPECTNCFGAHYTHECMISTEIILKRRQAVITAELRRQQTLALFSSSEYLSQRRNLPDPRSTSPTTVIHSHTEINTLDDCAIQLPYINLVNKNVKFPDTDCGICFETKEDRDICQYQCTHNYCKSCTVLHIKHCVQHNKQVYCPGCRNQITIIYK